MRRRFGKRIVLLLLVGLLTTLVVVATPGAGALRAGGFGAGLGPVLLQLPPNLEVDVPSLERVFHAFNGRVRRTCSVRMLM